MKVEVQKQHRWLSQLVGEWTYEHNTPPAPGEEPHKFTGTERVRMLGDVWVILEGEGNMPDGSLARSVITLGYDPQKKRFVGTFIGSTMTNLWVYEGELDEAERILTLDTEGPHFTTPGATTMYKDVIEIISNDERTLTSRALNDDGTWQEFMRATYRRTR